MLRVGADIIFRRVGYSRCSSVLSSLIVPYQERFLCASQGHRMQVSRSVLVVTIN